MRTQIIRVAAVILIALARGVLPSSAAAAPLDKIEARALMSNDIVTSAPWTIASAARSKTDCDAPTRSLTSCSRSTSRM